MSDRDPPLSRSEFSYFDTVETRWMDNDTYGHINNAVYYSYFDTVINRFMITHAQLDIVKRSVIALVVASSCRYHRALSFPQPLQAGLRVGRAGRTSIIWQIALFTSESDIAAADGSFVHVFVGHEDRRPVAIPTAVERALEKLGFRVS